MSDAEPIDLADALFDEPCPNCGGRLRSPSQTHCPQCGRQVKPASDEVPSPDAVKTSHDDHALLEVAAADPPPDVSTPAPVAARPASARPTPDGDDERPTDAAATTTAPRTGHIGGLRIALALAVTCAVVLSAGYLAGWGGLFPREDGLFRDANGAFTQETVRWSERAVDLVRTLVQRTVVWAAALGGLWAMAIMRRAPVPDWPAAAARMAAIAMATSLVTAIELPNRPIELTLEVLLQAALFVGLVVVWFRISFADAAQLLGVAALGFIVVHLGALLVVWATGSSLI